MKELIPVKIVFDNNALASATKWVCSIMDPKNDTASVRMEVKSPSEVVFSSSSMDGERSMVVPAIIKGMGDMEQPLKLQLPSSALKKVPVQSTSDSVVFSYADRQGAGKNRILVDCGIQLSIPLLSLSGRSLHNVDNMTHVGNLVPADLFNAVRMLSIISYSEKQLIYTCIDFKTIPSGNVIKAMAIDGCNMSVRDIPYTQVADETVRFLITAADVKSLTAASKSTSVELYVDKKAVAFVFDDGRMARINLITIQPAMYEGLIYGDRDESFRFERAGLLSAVSKLSSWNNEPDANITVDSGTGVMIVSSNTGDWTMQVPVMDCHITGEYSVMFPKAELVKMLQAADSEVLRAEFDRDNPSRPAFTWSQINQDGEVDDSVYLMTLPVIKASRNG